jgi:glycolate oxidase iron-sulfur subunit
MIDLFPPGRYHAIISNAGGCGSHLRRYGPLLEDDPVYRDRARLWDTQLRDVQEWLAEIGCRAPEASPGEEPIAVTYHESCHLVHGQKVSRQPRALLSMIPGISLDELPEATWCCGSAGIYAITQPEQAELLLTRKTANIVSTGAQYVAAANPGCHLQIARGLDAADARVQVVHPISLLAEAYRAER